MRQNSNNPSLDEGLRMMYVAVNVITVQARGCKGSHGYRDIVLAVGNGHSCLSWEYVGKTCLLGFAHFC